MKQTAVEWLIKKHFGSIENCSPNFKNHIEQAKAMERIQKAKEYLRGFNDGKEFKKKLDELTFKSE